MKHIILTLSLLTVPFASTPSLAGTCYIDRGMSMCDNGSVGIVAPAYPTYGQNRGLSVMTLDDDDDRQPQQQPHNCYMMPREPGDTSIIFPQCN